MKIILAICIGMLIGYAIPDAIPAQEPQVYKVLIEMPTGRVLTPAELAEGLCQYISFSGDTKSVTVYPGTTCVTVREQRR